MQSGLSNAIVKVFDTDNGKTKIEGLTEYTVDNETFYGLKSTAKGEFSSISITPAENTGTVNIKIEEKQAPGNYQRISGEVTLTIEYNTSTGDVTKISADNNEEYFNFGIDSTKGIIKIKNKTTQQYIYKIYKKNYQGEALSGVKFSAKIVIYKNGTPKYIYENLQWKNFNSSTWSDYSEYKITCNPSNSPNDGINVNFSDALSRTISDLMKYDGASMGLIITEDTAPAGYSKIKDRVVLNNGEKQEIYENSVEIKLMVNSNDGQESLVSSKSNIKDPYLSLEVGEYDMSAVIYNYKEQNLPNIQIKKVDSSNKVLITNNPAQFKIKCYVYKNVTNYTDVANHFNEDNNNNNNGFGDYSEILSETINTNNNGYLQIPLSEGTLDKLIDTEYDKEKVSIIAIQVEEETAPNGYTKSNSKYTLFIEVTKDENKNLKYSIWKTNGINQYTSNEWDYYSDNNTFECTVQNTKKPSLYIQKVNGNDITQKLSGAKFNYTVKTGENIIKQGNDVAVDSQGNYKIIFEETDIKNLEKGNLTISIKETNSPSGYILNNNQMSFKLKYENGKITLEDAPKDTAEYNLINAIDTVIRVKNYKPLDFYIKKLDGDYKTTQLEGAEYNIVAKYNDNDIDFIFRHYTGSDSNLAYLNDGYNGITSITKDGVTTIRIENYDIINSLNKQNFKLEIMETKTPNKYSLNTFANCISLGEFKCNNNKIVAISSLIKAINNAKGDYKTVANSNIIEIYNYKVTPILLKILKTDAISSEGLKGAKFNITLTNVASIGDYSSSLTDETIILKNVTTDENGNIKLEDLLISNFNKDITIKVEETETPQGYKKINGTITVTLKRDGNNYTVRTATKDSTVTDDEFQAGNVAITNNNTLSLKIENIPASITLSGKVWLDGQIGTKKVETINGQYDYVDADNEKLLEGIKVYLYNANGTYANETRTTDKNGQYEFKDIPKTVDGYYVEFEYDGINYTNTITGKQSKAVEDTDKRTAFNSRFKTIIKDQSNDGTPLSYITSGGIATLNAGIDGTNPASTDKTFKMQANTKKAGNIYTETTENIDYGLQKKFFDLELGKDVDSATVTINGKSTTYSYKELVDGFKTENQQELIYNLYLYYSDYYYRINDYITAENRGITNSINNNDSINFNNNQGAELEVEVTYKVVLFNQSTYAASIDEFVDYYDSNYTYVRCEGGTVIKDQNSNKLIVTPNNGDVSSTNDYRQEIYLTFKVNKNDNAVILGQYSNLAEITKYSTTEGGLIDNDSAPGNAVPGNKDTYENDTATAPGLDIKLKNESRTITGTVWDDGKKTEANGKLESGESGVNDVIVQLIEVKRINDKYYEYIWQETRSGSNSVKTTAKNGYEGESYTNSVQENSANYEFKNFIPGNYIIRFIYGDGTSEDVKTYNGQDYQSTIDKKYNESWYNTADYIDEKSSVARDNEARRLEVMAYSSVIDGTIGTALEEKTTLDKTWMAAETSRINIPVDADNKITIADNTTVEDGNNQTAIVFSNMNFGLAKRPETKLVLEKHITALKITPSGTGVQPIVDAKIDINKILEGTMETQGLTDGLSTIESTRGERGWWKVETDIEELAQGATLEVEYTYVIKDESEEDYLSSTLVNAYSNNIGKDDKNDKLENNADEKDDYSNYLLNTKTSTKALMRLGNYAYSENNQIGESLGEFYYTGIEGIKDSAVTSRAEQLEEAINEKLKHDESIAGNSFIESDETKNETVKKSYIDTNGNLVVNGREIETVLLTSGASEFLFTGNNDTNKTLKLTTVLSSSSNGEIGGNYPSYLAEIVKYSNAAGRRNMVATPDNLTYVHSEDTRLTLDTYADNDGKWYRKSTNGTIYELNVVNSTKWEVSSLAAIPATAKAINEDDEFWGETIMISKPTGEDKASGMQIGIIVASSLAVLGVGIILIKKYALKTK